MNSDDGSITFNDLVGKLETTAGSPDPWRVLERLGC
jgi:hypothetical protein